ncbi:MAG: type IV secretory system conjugative DNA transfer family protein, partial [Coriobacteriales bacterium]
MQKLNPRSLIIAAVLSLLAAYFGNRFTQAAVTAPQETILPSLEAIGETFTGLLAASPLSIYTGSGGAIGAGVAFASVWLAYLYKAVSNLYRRPGEEHGSSRWGTKADIKPFLNPDPDMNIILSQTEGMNIEEFVKNPKYSRNKNVCVIGGSGTGKTRFFVKPNLMQLHSSYVVTDPKGDIYDDMYDMF